MESNQVKLSSLQATQAFSFYGTKYHVVSTSKESHFIVNNHATGQNESMNKDHAVTVD